MDTLSFMSCVLLSSEEMLFLVCKAATSVALAAIISRAEVIETKVFGFILS